MKYANIYFGLVLIKIYIFFEGVMLMKKSLIAYFSATGNTKKLAKNLSEVISSDLFEIEPKNIYTEKDLDWHDEKSRSSIEMKDESSRPEIKNKVENMRDYEVVFLGFPIWWYTAPRIIDTFLESYDFSGKTIIPFATSGSSEMGDIGKTLRNLCKCQADFREGKRFASYDATSLKEWINSLNI